MATSAANPSSALSHVPGASCLVSASLKYHERVDSVLPMFAGKLRLNRVNSVSFKVRELMSGKAEAASETWASEASLCS